MHISISGTCSVVDNINIDRKNGDNYSQGKETHEFFLFFLLNVHIHLFFFYMYVMHLSLYTHTSPTYKQGHNTKVISHIEHEVEA